MRKWPNLASAPKEYLSFDSEDTYNLEYDDAMTVIVLLFWYIELTAMQKQNGELDVDIELKESNSNFVCVCFVSIILFKKQRKHGKCKWFESIPGESD